MDEHGVSKLHKSPAVQFTDFCHYDIIYPRNQKLLIVKQSTVSDYYRIIPEGVIIFVLKLSHLY